MSIDKKCGVILLGPPGSGKTSAAKKLSGNIEVVFIETGDLLRNEVESKSDLGKKLKPYLEEGKLAPSELVVKVFDKKISEIEAEVVVFDGSPRREEEIGPFKKMISNNNIEISRVIIFDIDDEAAAKRLTGRRICENCGTIYNIHLDPPENKRLCDKCGGKLIQRKDDRPEVVQKRIDEFEEKTLPVIKYFEENYSEEVLHVNAEKSINEVYETIWKEVKEKLKEKAN